MRVSGGVLETIRLARELRARGTDARILTLWKHPNQVQRIDVPGIADVPVSYLSQLAPHKLRAPFDLFVLMLRYRLHLKELRRQTKGIAPAVVLTHYVTLPFGWFTPRARRYCFVQDEEWLFLSNGLHRQALRKFIQLTCAHCHVITANAYIDERMRFAGINSVAEAPIWASPVFAAASVSNHRSVDIVMLLRHGHIKRLDLYMRLLDQIKQSYHFTCAVITCEDDIADEASKFTETCLLRPSSVEMKELFQRSKIFVLLSEREGFGLPPLEAMGAGCVPVCRDSGGVRCYMKGALEKNLIPLEASFEVIVERLRDLLSDQETLEELSMEAKRIFVNGLEESEKKREQALALLSTM